MKNILRTPCTILWTVIASFAAGSNSVAASDTGAIPTLEQAIVQKEPGEPETLHLLQIPVIPPGKGQVLIRVHAASINPSDWMSIHNPLRSPEGRVGGLDAAGVIVAVGEGVTDRPVGMPVFAVVAKPGLTGAWAEYALALAASTAPKPANISYAQAAGLGTVAIVALQSLDAAQVHAGQRVLITGVAGGIGSAAAQIARARGAVVIGTASPRHDAYLRSIGVSKVIDYTKGDVAQQAGTVDAVIDTVGGSEAVEALQALKPGGLFSSPARVKFTSNNCDVLVGADGSQVRSTIPEVHAAHKICLGSPGVTQNAPTSVLMDVAELARNGNLVIHIDKTFPLAQAAEALKYNHEGHTEGKVVLVMVKNER